jgi:hypothetical protein
MKRNTYYLILAFALLIVFILGFLKLSSYRPSNGPKLAIALFILACETAYAQKPINIINFCLLPFAFFGWSFIIMHWPFSHLLFFGSLFMMFALILTDILRKKILDVTALVVMTFPVCHYILMIAIAYRLGWEIYYISRIEYVLAGIIAGVLFYTIIFKKQELKS